MVLILLTQLEFMLMEYLTCITLVTQKSLNKPKSYLSIAISLWESVVMKMLCVIKANLS